MIDTHPSSHRQGRRRPALYAASAVALGIVWAAHAQSPWTWSGCGLAGAGLLLDCAVRRRSFARALMLALLCLAGATRYAALHFATPSTDLSRYPPGRERCRIYGQVASEPESRDDKQVFVLALDSIASAPTALRRTGRVQVQLRTDRGVPYGAYVECSGWLSSATRARNPDEFDYAAFLARRDIVARFHADSMGTDGIRRVAPGLDVTGWLIIPLRQWIYGSLGRHLKGEPADLLLGLLFGERSGLSPELEAQFQNTGTLHLLAVSGSNVAVVLAVIWGTLGFLRIPGTFRRVLSLSALFVFSALAYHEPSVVRAAVAAALATVGFARHRSVDPINLWGGTLFVLLLWEPRQLFEVGFQLSFLATLGILTGAPLFGRLVRGAGFWRRTLRLLLLALGVSISAQLAVIPVLAGSFNQVPLVTPISNLVCVPAAGLATAAGVVAILAATLGGWIGAVTSAAAWISVEFLILAVGAFDALDFPQWQPASPSLFSALLYYVLLAALRQFAVERNARRPILFGALVAVSLAVWIGARPAPLKLEIVHLDLGARAGSLVRWPDRSVWLIAAGDRPPGNVWRNTVTPFLRRRGWREPTLFLCLDPELTGAEVRAEWPDIRVLASAAATSSAAHELVPAPYRWTAYGYDSAPGGWWALRLESPLWQFYWFRNHNGLKILEPQLGRQTWAAVPGLPWDYRRYLDFDSGLYLLETSRALPPGPGSPAPGEPRVFRILTSGAVVTSESGGELDAEPSIR